MTPGAIAQKAERLYVPFLRAWLQDEPFFPQALPVGKLPADYVALSAAVARLLQSAKARRGYGYSVELRTQRTQRHGAQSLPARIVIESAGDLLRLIGKDAEFAAFQQDVALIRAQVPELCDWVVRHPQQVVEHHGEWPDLLRVCAYFLAHPRPNCYIRELPIAVHTKFVETHAGILRRLLDAALPPAALEPEAVTRGLQAAPFEKRFGLHYDEPLIRVRFLDDELRQRCGVPLSDISAPLSQIATLPLRGHRVVVTENKMTFLTLPALRETFAIFGGGFHVELLTTIDWLAECTLVYWGDLDAQGFQILSLLRASLPHVVAVMMDDATFEAFRDFAVPGTPCAVADLPHLTPEEHALFVRLAREQVRLEQERISHAYAIDKLLALDA